MNREEYIRLYGSPYGEDTIPIQDRKIVRQWKESQVAKKAFLRKREERKKAAKLKREARLAALRKGRVVYVLEKTRKSSSLRLKTTAFTDALFEDAQKKRQEAAKKAEERRPHGLLPRSSVGKISERRMHIPHGFIQCINLHPSYEYRVSTMVTGGNDGSYPYGRWVRSKGSSDAQWGSSMVWGKPKRSF
tara:strand:+ start:4346 stop:4915 length:570 start_codon:yes stop_codon:yes gene_type:complete